MSIPQWLFWLTIVSRNNRATSRLWFRNIRTEGVVSKKMVYCDLLTAHRLSTACSCTKLIIYAFKHKTGRAWCSLVHKYFDEAALQKTTLNVTNTTAEFNVLKTTAGFSGESTRHCYVTDKIVETYTSMQGKPGREVAPVITSKRLGLRNPVSRKAADPFAFLTVWTFLQQISWSGSFGIRRTVPLFTLTLKQANDIGH